MNTNSISGIKTHVNYDTEKDIPYWHEIILGSGGYAIVDKVELLRDERGATEQFFARKSIRINCIVLVLFAWRRIGQRYGTPILQIGVNDQHIIYSY
jgi:hypothetical protein